MNEIIDNNKTDIGMNCVKFFIIIENSRVKFIYYYIIYPFGELSNFKML